MAGDEPRTAFDLAFRRPSNPAEESGSPSPSGKRQIGESRGEAAWQHPHQVKEWFAHIDDRREDIMMSSCDERAAGGRPRSAAAGDANSNCFPKSLACALRA
jgi:hypothetical protein